MKNMKYVGMVSVLCTFPFTYVFAQNPGYITTLTSGIMTTITALVPVLLSLALAFFVWGLVMFIAQSGNEKVREEGKQKMIWGIISLFVIVSVWGLVSLLQQIAGVTGNAGALTTPETTYTP